MHNSFGLLVLIYALYDDHSLPGAIILKMSHGYTISPDGPDPLVELANEAVGTIFAEACHPGTWLVDIVPICM